MVAKKQTKPEAKKVEQAYDNLYVNLTDANEKRRNILDSIKNALVMQEEQERVVELRKDKTVVLNDIRKELYSVNSSYQKLKKHLPNVKNVISYTEKELTMLESSIEMLKDDMRADQENVTLEEHIQGELQEGQSVKKVRKSLSDKAGTKEKIVQEVKAEMLKPKKKGKLSRLDRIQNNLKVIESKLGDFKQ